jgi:hypothetical protein
MRRALLVGAFSLAFVATTGLSGQEPKPQDPKTKDVKPDMRFKGQLPSYWGMIGLTDDQREKVYALQAKYNQDIDKLEKQIKDMKEKMSKERFEVLSAEQKTALEDIIRKKAGGGK